LWSFDVVVWVRIYTIARLLGRILLQIPWTPLGDLILVDVLLKGQWEGGIGAEKVGVFWIRIVTLWSQQPVCAFARRVGEVWGDVVERDVVERL
jgi:hypothetical protein